MDSPRCHSLGKGEERREAAASQASPLSTSQDVMTLLYVSQRMRSPVAVGSSSEDHTNDTRRSRRHTYVHCKSGSRKRNRQSWKRETGPPHQSPASLPQRITLEMFRMLPFAPPVKPFAGPHPHMTTHPAPSATRHVSCDTPVWAASCRQWHTDVGLKHETEHPLLDIVCTFSSWLVSFSPINMRPPSFNALHSPGPRHSPSNMGPFVSI
ncbi:hypothetical protein EDB80DRAFT_840277 [Ilyonectria destructans]|nr:hypothetical protein EDB80DRAFT_840277 [Ilyonectria destructans]